MSYAFNQDSIQQHALHVPGPPGSAAPEDICPVHVQHDVRLVLLEGCMHLVEQPGIFPSHSGSWLQAWGVNESDPYPAHIPRHLPDAVGAQLVCIRRSSLTPASQRVGFCVTLLMPRPWVPQIQACRAQTTFASPGLIWIVALEEW